MAWVGRGGLRPPWVREAVTLAALYAAYTGLRLLVTGDRAAALDNAGRILAWERPLRLDVEQGLNAFVSARPAAALALCFGYAALHDLATVGVLVWLWLRRPAAYRAARTALVVATGAALLGFWLFPLAPPRMLPGFIDTMAAYADYGWWGGGAAPTNEFAALPSVHVAWACWCGLQLVRYGGRVARAAGVAYAVFVVAVVVGTANHYVLDVVAGVAVLGLGLPAAAALAAARPAARRAGREAIPPAPPVLPPPSLRAPR